MQTQPQLLLLQKTMLVAEGVGRRLHPDTNMWELAKPLIDDWVEDALSPEAKTAEVMAEAGRLIERLPTLITDMNDSVSALSRDGLKLHPDTVNAMSGGRRIGSLAVVGRRRNSHRASYCCQLKGNRNKFPFDL